MTRSARDADAGAGALEGRERTRRRRRSRRGGPGCRRHGGLRRAAPRSPVTRGHAERGAVGEDVDVERAERAGADVGQRRARLRQLLQTRHRALVVAGDGRLDRDEVRREVAAAGRASSADSPANSSSGSRAGRSTPAPRPAKSACARHEELVAERTATGQERRQVGRVARLLRRPERPRLRQLALPLLGECVGDGAAYGVRVGSRASRRHARAHGIRAITGQLFARSAICRRRPRTLCRVAPTSVAAAVASSNAGGWRSLTYSRFQVDPRLPTSA